MAYSGDESILKSAAMGVEWVKQIDGCLELSLGQLLPSISRVPEYAKVPDSDFYTPQLVGLGPFHHFRPQLSEMTAVKRRFVEQGLRRLNFPGDLDTFTAQVVTPLLPAIRAQYDAYLDILDSTLASAVALDSLFLVELLRLGCSDEEEDPAFESSSGRSTVQTVLISDVLMLENQIPLFLLHDPISGGSEGQIRDFYNSQLQRAFQHISPLQFLGEDRNDDLVTYPHHGRPRHLLEYLYFQIVGGVEEDSITTTDYFEFELDSSSTDVLLDIRYLYFEEEDSITTDTSLTSVILGIMKMAPAGASLRKLRRQHEQNFTMAYFNAFDLVLDTVRTYGGRILKRLGLLDHAGFVVSLVTSFGISPRYRKTSIPTASCLTRHGMRILPADRGTSLQAMVSFDQEEETLRLPVLTLKPNCGVVVRNMVAYESMTKADDDRVLTAYWWLMNSLVDTAEDMKVLREAGVVVIIDGDDDNPMREMMPSLVNINPFEDNSVGSLTSKIEAAGNREAATTALDSQIQALTYCYNRRRGPFSCQNLLRSQVIWIKLYCLFLIAFAAQLWYLYLLYPAFMLVKQFVSYECLHHWPCCPHGLWAALVSLAASGFVLKIVQVLFQIRKE